MTRSFSPSMYRLSYPFQYLSAPILVGVYPAIFHYGNNAHLVLFSSFIELLIVSIIVSLVIFCMIYLIVRGNAFQAAIGTLAFLLFFNLYGPLFDGFKSLDLIQVETYTFLPFYLVLSGYFTFGLTKLSPTRSAKIVKLIVLILTVLVLFNLIKIIPVELRKIRTVEVEERVLSNQKEAHNYPDIYYLIFDEAAGFEVIRQYWRDNSVDEFVHFLQSKGFYIAEESRSKSLKTLREISTRLNYQDYPEGDDYFDLYYDAIANNRVMGFLKNLGYSVVAFDQRRDAFPTAAPLPADVLIEEPPEFILSSFSWLDDYKMLVLHNTLLRPFLVNFTPNIAKHRDMIFYTIENVAGSYVPSPKFVYVHLMIPHVPFMFNERGDIVVGLAEHYNWQRYLGNYQYFLHLSTLMIENIFHSLVSEQPPVIIIQSDHGARNIDSRPYIGILENYPEEYKTLIVNAMYLPGCEDAPLTQDMDPINTFPIIFNCFFDAKIPLQ